MDEILGRVDTPRINPDVYEIFVDEKNKFVAAMGVVLDNIATKVESGLTAAQTQIQLGKTWIALFKLTLKGAELVYAEQLETEVKLKFDNLEGSINDTRDDLLQTLADQYRENVTQLEKTFNEINDELKKSWIDRAIEFVKTVGKTIFELGELLLTILTRMAHLVWSIIKHPIRFFETLVSGLMQGIWRFIDNIGTYLQEAFWTWITGATSVTSIHLSSSSGIEGLFDLIVQVLRLGPADLRLIVERVLGKKFMELVDKGLAVGEKLLEPVTILLDKGPVALWEYLKESLGDLIQSGIDRIKETVFFTFVEKALKWVAGFFIPGGGFVKIVKAIFSAFQFVVENLDNIRHFFEAVFDSMEAAIEGHTEGVASKIVEGLRTGVVLALDFLAKQLGLSKIIESVHNIIQSLRRPIVSAIEWVLGKAKPLVMKLMMKGRQLVEKGKQAGARVVEWWRRKRRFRAGGEVHSIYFEGNRLMVETEKHVAEEYLQRALTVGGLSGDQARVVGQGLALIERLKRERRETQKAAPRAEGSEIEDTYNQTIEAIKIAISHVVEAAAGGVSTKIEYSGALHHDQGDTATANPLTFRGPLGTDPGGAAANTAIARALQPRRSGNGSYYVLGHLINQRLHGRGDDPRNIALMPQEANGSFEREVESRVKEAVYERGEQVLQRGSIRSDRQVRRQQQAGKDRQAAGRDPDQP